MTRAQPFQVTGRMVLITMVAFFAVIFSVNALFITMAAQTFPGIVTEKPFKKGLARDFNSERAALAEQAERGWRAGVEHAFNAGAQTAQVRVVMVDDYDRPLSGLALTGAMGRVIDADADQALAFVEVEPGLYQAEAAGVSAGRWKLTFATAFPDGAPFRAQRTVCLPDADACRRW